MFCNVFQAFSGPREEKIASRWLTFARIGQNLSRIWLKVQVILNNMIKNLSRPFKNVQKRIATLTKKMREQERAAQSAYEYARSLQEENNNLKTSNSEAHQNYYSEAENRLKSQRAQANSVLKSAFNLEISSR